MTIKIELTKAEVRCALAYLSASANDEIEGRDAPLLRAIVTKLQGALNEKTRLRLRG